MTYYKEEQRFRNPGLIALLGLMSFLVIYRLGLSAVEGPDVRVLSITAGIALLIGAAWYALFRSRLRIKVNDKCLKVKLKGLIGGRLKLPTCDMVDCTFVDVAPSARWSGVLAHPSSDFSSIDFGGRKGLYIRMRNGQSYFIGSDGLFARRDELPLPTPAQAS